jgi:hypothetical protein
VIEFLLVSSIALWLVVLALVASQFAVLRHLGQQLLNAPERKQAQGPDLGMALPHAQLTTLDNRIARIGGQRERAAFLYVASTTCEPCRNGRDALARFSQRYASELDTILVCRGRTDEDVRAFAATLPPTVHVVADRSSAFATRLRISHTPYAFIVDRDSIVRGKGSPDGDLAFDWFHQQLRLAAGELAPTITFIADATPLHASDQPLRLEVRQ